MATETAEAALGEAQQAEVATAEAETAAVAMAQVPWGVAAMAEVAVKEDRVKEEVKTEVALSVDFAVMVGTPEAAEG